MKSFNENIAGVVKVTPVANVGRSSTQRSRDKRIRYQYKKYAGTDKEELAKRAVILRCERDRITDEIRALDGALQMQQL